MKSSSFAARLLAEYEFRRAANRRYSLRAFARFLGVDHSTLGQILRGQRPAPSASIRAFGGRIGLGPEEISAYVAAEHLPSEEHLDRLSQLRHWTAEALAVASQPLHYRISQLTARADFQPDLRWIAERAGATVDEIAIAVQRLLRLGLLRMDGPRWVCAASSGEDDFRAQALERVRRLAPLHHRK